MFVRIYNAIQWLSQKINKVVGVILILLSVPLVAVILYAVFMRYVLNMAPTWSEEVARYLMVWLGLLASSVALKQGQHIGLSSVVDRLFSSYRRYVYFLADLFMMFFFLVVFIEGVSMTIFVAPQRSPSAVIPMWIPYLSVPAGSLLMFIQALCLALEKFKPKQTQTQKT
ncbi:TRAP transporter small permease [Candidatus Aerophobetes bacterium]|nr:TRAP transporter small permease [Candidatus Aerophobetes bacterium]